MFCLFSTLEDAQKGELLEEQSKFRLTNSRRDLISQDFVSVRTQLTEVCLPAAIPWNDELKFHAESHFWIWLCHNFLASRFATLGSRFFLHTYFNSLLCWTGGVSDYAYLLYLTSWAIVPFEGQWSEGENIEGIDHCLICRKSKEVDQVQKFT